MNRTSADRRMGKCVKNLSFPWGIGMLKACLSVEGTLQRIVQSNYISLISLGQPSRRLI